MRPTEIPVAEVPQDACPGPTEPDLTAALDAAIEMNLINSVDADLILRDTG